MIHDTSIFGPLFEFYFGGLKTWVWDLLGIRNSVNSTNMTNQSECISGHNLVHQIFSQRTDHQVRPSPYFLS